MVLQECFSNITGTTCNTHGGQVSILWKSSIYLITVDLVDHRIRFLNSCPVKCIQTKIPRFTRYWWRVILFTWANKTDVRDNIHKVVFAINFRIRRGAENEKQSISQFIHREIELVPNQNVEIRMGRRGRGHCCRPGSYADVCAYDLVCTLKPTINRRDKN